MSEALAIGRPKWQRWLPFLAGAPELTARQWRVLGLVSVASLFDQYDMSLFGMALPQIQTGLGIAEGDVGWLGSILRLGSLPQSSSRSRPIMAGGGRCSARSSRTRR
jgi:hypothetical protein